ncbi:MAG TPA: hypothetical protein VLH39_00355 [Magnetospirillaceae bacterium]|nr:hypothetical protein [Magnetospirillaceae bacterium]
MRRTSRRTAGRTAAAVLSAILVSASVLSLTACQAGFLFDIWDELLAPGLDITPSEAVLEPTQSLTLTAVGGWGPYSFSKTLGYGTLTDHNDGTAEYQADGGETTVSILLSDSRGKEVLANIRVSAATIELLRILPTSASLLYGETLDFEASGGQAPYVFSIVSGAGSVYTDGRYTAPDHDTDAVVQVEDDFGQAAKASVTVRAAPQPLAIVPDTLVIEEYGVFTFSATGGTGSYTFSTSGGSLTDNGDGTWDFTAPDDPATVMVTVSDLAIPPGTADASVTVVAASPEPLTIVPRSINVTMGSTFQFSAEGGGGPYTFEMERGHGGSVTSAGLYTAPTDRPGTERVRVTDGRGITDTATVKVRRK